METKMAQSSAHQDPANSWQWMRNIYHYDALEIHPCAVIGRDLFRRDIVEQCEPKEAHVWTVYGHLRNGGVHDFEDFPTEADAIAFHDRLIGIWPHLAGPEGGQS
jgi:hypothetical protein